MSHQDASHSAHTAPASSTQRAPMASITGPNTRLPSGTVPPKAMNHRLITRPRSWSARRLCSTVIIDVVVPKYATPRKKPLTNAPIGSRAIANAARHTANAAKPSRMRRRLSHPTNTVPIASAPRQAPRPQVAYSHLYVDVRPSMPKLSSATAANSPT